MTGRRAPSAASGLFSRRAPGDRRRARGPEGAATSTARMSAGREAGSGRVRRGAAPINRPLRLDGLRNVDPADGAPSLAAKAMDRLGLLPPHGTGEEGRLQAGRRGAARAAGVALRRSAEAQMRIAGGRLGGRVLAAPASRAIRPTSERLRESIFDIIAHGRPGHIEGARVVDLFAGSGALGIEALSRGARFALFVDNGAEARALIRANVEALGLGGVTRIWRADATRLGKKPASGPFALAFLDPPYGRDLAAPALVSLVEGGWLTRDALCVAEEAVKAKIVAPPGLRLVDERIYGDTRLAILEPSPEAVPIA